MFNFNLFEKEEKKQGIPQEELEEEEEEQEGACLVMLVTFSGTLQFLEASESESNPTVTGFIGDITFLWHLWI
jgi:hypothetical protein